MNEKLLPCPFCGGEADLRMTYVQRNDVVTIATRITCKVCGANTGDKYTEADAVYRWNTRNHIEQIMERLKELVNEHKEREETARKAGLTRHADLNGIKAYIIEDVIEIVKEGCNMDG